MKALYGHENPPSAQDVIEGRLIQIGLRALEPRHQRRDRLRPLEPGRALVATAGSRRPRRDRSEMRYFDSPRPSSEDDSPSAPSRSAPHVVAHVRRGARRVGCHHRRPDAQASSTAVNP